MADYLVYRTGCNAANQPWTFDAVPIAIVSAKTRAHACATTWGKGRPSVGSCPHLLAWDDGRVVAAVVDTNVWPNQRLHAVPRSRARRSDLDFVLREDIYRQEVELVAEELAWNYMDSR